MILIGGDPTIPAMVAAIRRLLARQDCPQYAREAAEPFLDRHEEKP